MTTRTSHSRTLGASGNNSRRSQGGVSQNKGGATVKGTTISFTSPGTIADSGNGFGALRAGDRVELRGSPKNSRRFTVGTASAGSLTVVPAMVTSEVAGAAITLRRVS